MKPLPRAVLEHARHHRGLLTAAALTEHGVGRACPFRRPRVGTARSSSPRRVHLDGQPQTFEQRCLAACLAAPDASISGPTAGRLWGLRKVFTDEVHILARRAIDLSNVTAHRTDLLGDGDVTELEGIRVLRPGRLLCDLASHLDETNLESVLEQMIARRVLAVHSSSRGGQAFRSTRSARISAVLEPVLDSRPDWLKPAESDLELRLSARTQSGGLVLERQSPSPWTAGRRLSARPRRSHGISRRRGRPCHVARWSLDVQGDKRRDRELARVGWLISRVTDSDVRDRSRCDRRRTVARPGKPFPWIRNHANRLADRRRFLSRFPRVQDRLERAAVPRPDL